MLLGNIYGRNEVWDQLNRFKDYKGGCFMCGIYGCIGEKISKETAEYCCRQLYHRGPDGEGIWQEGDVTLAHRRLAIIDLSETGKQPMSFEGGRYWITFNGEIYNYIEIKKELKEKGYLFEGDSDTEVILAAYKEWDDLCVLHFNGMWAFTIYDKLEKKAFMSRDRFGVKPLYYSLTDKRLVFASEMKAIMPCLDKIEINYQMINFFRIFHHYEFKENCLIKGIKRFPAGCNAIYKNGKLLIKRYWNTLDHLTEIPSDYREQAEMFRHLFLDACRLRMRSDVPIGTSLSGGLDSSAVLCAMHNIASAEMESTYQKDWQHAYVAGFDGSVMDETAYAKKVTDFVGIGSTRININNNLDEDMLFKQAYLFEELWMNSQIPQMIVYENERKDGTVVSVDGHGADELFGGYTYNMQFAMLDVRGEDLFEIAGVIQEAEKYKDDLVDMNRWIKKRIRYVKIRNIYEQMYRRVILKGDYFRHSQFKYLDRMSQSLCIETHERILQTLLRNYDRDSMANGVEIRMPFMDYRIVSFAMSLPWNSKIRNGFSKSIIRDGLKDIMPAEIVYRRDKKGFNAPIGEWIRESAEIYLDLVNSSAFANCTTVKNPKVIRKALIDFVKNKDSDYIADFGTAQRLWLEINMFIWEEAMTKKRYCV